MRIIVCNKQMGRLTQMPFSYKEWLENFLIPTLKRQGINAQLAEDGAIVCEKNGYKQVTPKEAAYSKYEEYLAKYPE